VNYNFNFDPIWRNFDSLLSGLGLGLLLALVSIAMGIVIGLVAAFAMVSKRAFPRRVARTYVTAIRNTPILVLILFVFFALPELGITLGKITSFVATLTVYSGAYMAEVFRGGLAAVPDGLSEAGLAIGMTPRETNLTIVLPVMFRDVLPALSNNFISLFKDTSLASAIAVPELTFYAREINANTFRVIEAWTIASLLYVVTCYVMAVGLRRVERKMALPR